MKIRRKKYNIFSVFIIVVLILMILTTETYALNTNKLINRGKNFVKKGTSNILNFEVIYYLFDYLYNFLLLIGIIVAAIYGTILGIRMILGGVQERVDARNMIGPYIAIVTIMAFAFTIIKFVMTIMYSAIT